MTEARPALTADLDVAEFARWYWLKEELQGFARTLGIRATGGKEMLADRIAARLAGRPFVEPSIVARGGPQLDGSLTDGTRIPAGQRCSQHLRSWFAQRLGPGFRYDAAMREFFEEVDGTQTLADAVEHWQATRGTAAGEITAQFEYNRFTRAWHAEHPSATRDEVIAAWKDYRTRPIDQRGRA